MAHPVSYELADGIATITMDDGKANALSPIMLAAVDEALDRARDDEAIVILSGRTGIFSGGFDLEVLGGGGPDAGRMLEGGFLLALRQLEHPFPVVIACTGHAIAMGSFSSCRATTASGSRARTAWWPTKWPSGSRCLERRSRSVVFGLRRRTSNGRCCSPRPTRPQMVLRLDSWTGSFPIPPSGRRRSRWRSSSPDSIHTLMHRRRPWPAPPPSTPSEQGSQPTGRSSTAWNRRTRPWSVLGVGGARSVATSRHRR